MLIVPLLYRVISHICARILVVIARRRVDAEPQTLHALQIRTGRSTLVPGPDKDDAQLEARRGVRSDEQDDAALGIPSCYHWSFRSQQGCQAAGDLKRSSFDSLPPGPL